MFVRFSYGFDMVFYKFNVFIQFGGRVYIQEVVFYFIFLFFDYFEWFKYDEEDKGQIYEGECCGFVIVEINGRYSKFCEVECFMF